MLKKNPGHTYCTYLTASSDTLGSWPIAAYICFKNNTGTEIITNTIKFRKSYLLSMTLQNLRSLSPNAGATSEAATDEKPEDMESRRIPQVKVPRPNPARYISPIYPA